MRRLILGIVCLAVLHIFNCSKAIKSSKPGQVYVVNNLCPNPSYVVGFNTGGYELTIDWEGEPILVDHNMYATGEPTGVGSVQITRDPLPGGTVVDFDYTFLSYAKTRVEKRLSEVLRSYGTTAIIDGDITIEFYSFQWAPQKMSQWTDHAAKIIAGECNDIHAYEELQ